MANNLIIEILPQKYIFPLEMDPDTQIHELLEFIQIQYNLNPQTKNWTCYSNLKRMFFYHNSSIGNANNDKITINTCPQAKQSTPEGYNKNFLNNNNCQIYFPALIEYQQNQSQNNIGYKTQSEWDSRKTPQCYSNYIPKKYQIQEAEVTINFEIINRNMKCQLQCTYRRDDIIDDLADTVLAYLRVSKQRASCDLFIYNQSLNNYNTRLEPIYKKQIIKSGITVVAQLRWIGKRI